MPLRRHVWIGVAMAAVLAGGLAPTSGAAAADQHHDRGQRGGITPYAYRANTFGTKVVVNGVETIDDACVLGVCGGGLYSRWNENDLRSGALKLEQSFRGGTGAFTKAHGSIRVVDPVNFAFSCRVGI